MDKKMRLIIRSLLLCGMLSLTSCAQDNLSDTQGEILPEGKYPLELTASGLDVVASPTTRATVDGNWEGITGTVAVSIDDVSPAKQYKVTPSSDNKSASLSAAEKETPFYWQSSGETKNITAWYPYSATYPGNSWEVRVDQSNAGGGYQKSDLIKGVLSLKFSDRNEPTKNKIPFVHQTAKIVIKIDANSKGSFTEAQLKAATVRIENINGVETGSSITNMYRLDDGNQCALVMPQTITAGRHLFSFNIEGNETFYYTVPIGGITWEAGCQYTYTITVRGTKLDVSTTSTISWDPTGGSEGNGTVGI